MSVPKNNDGQPSAPQSTPASRAGNTPTTDNSGTLDSWIPGLGSAVRPQPRTPQYAEKGGPLPESVGVPKHGAHGAHVPAMRAVPTPTRVVPPPITTTAPLPKNTNVTSKTAVVPPTGWQNFIDTRGATSVASAAVVTSTSTSGSRPVQGLGGVSQSFNGFKAAPLSAKAATVKYTQTEEYHRSDPPTVHTAPLPQTGFYPLSDRTTSDRDDSTSCALTDPTSSEASIGLSEHYLKQHPEQANFKAPPWVETANPRSIRYALNDASAEWEEAYPGALQTLSQLNPAQYVMPFGVSCCFDVNRITS